MKISSGNRRSKSNRRSGFNRRWINSTYTGAERRKGTDRRSGRDRRHSNSTMVPFEKTLPESGKQAPEALPCPAGTPDQVEQ